MDFLQSLIKQAPVEQILSGIVSDVRFRTEFTDEKSVLNAKQMADLIQQRGSPKGQQEGAAGRLLKLIKPTVIIKSPVMGDRVYAPYGEAAPISASIWRNRLGLALTATVLVLVGTGFALGRASKK